MLTGKAAVHRLFLLFRLDSGFHELYSYELIFIYYNSESQTLRTGDTGRQTEERNIR